MWVLSTKDGNTHLRVHVMVFKNARNWHSGIQILIRFFLFMLCEDMIGNYCNGYG
jgi:hypothetical protein